MKTPKFEYNPPLIIPPLGYFHHSFILILFDPFYIRNRLHVVGVYSCRPITSFMLTARYRFHPVSLFIMIIVTVSFGGNVAQETIIHSLDEISDLTVKEGWSMLERQFMKHGPSHHPKRSNDRLNIKE